MGGTAAVAGTVGVTGAAISLNQVVGNQDFAVCREGGISSCARLNLEFDDFDGTLNIFDRLLERKLQSDLSDDTRFFEVVKKLIRSTMVLQLKQYNFRHLIVRFW